MNPGFTTVRTAARRRRAATVDRRRLARELATFTTPAERLELDLFIARHDPEETAEVDAILRRQDAARQAARTASTPAFVAHRLDAA